MNPILKHKKILINVTITSSTDLHQLNKKYLNIDASTDVLSFNIDQEIDDKTYYLGDIVVNIDQAVKQAPKFKNTTEEELSELIGHGVLHLLGVHHEGDNDKEVHGVDVKRIKKTGK